MTQRRLHFWKPLLVALGLGFLVLVAGVSWGLYKAQHPKGLSFAQVQQSLVGKTPAIIHRVIGWGSKRYGFDDGSDWIEFKTDSSGLKALLESRPFVKVPTDRKAGLHDWDLNPEDWRELDAMYEDDSDFEKHGATYYLITQNDKDGILALIARSQQ